MSAKRTLPGRWDFVRLAYRRGQKSVRGLSNLRRKIAVSICNPPKLWPKWLSPAGEQYF